MVYLQRIGRHSDNCGGTVGPLFFILKCQRMVKMQRSTVHIILNDHTQRGKTVKNTDLNKESEKS